MRVWGRAPQQFATGRDIYQQLAAAEPHATEARKEELRTLARAQAQHAVPFWDVSVSVSKSVTLFYGGLLAAAEQARQAGDVAAAEERQAAKARESIMEGNRGRRWSTCRTRPGSPAPAITAARVPNAERSGEMGARTGLGDLLVPVVHKP